MIVALSLVLGGFGTARAYTITETQVYIDDIGIFIPCLDIPNKALSPVSASGLIGIGTSTYPLYLFGEGTLNKSGYTSSHTFCQDYIGYATGFQTYPKSGLGSPPIGYYYLITGYKNDTIENWSDIDYYYGKFYYNGINYIASTTKSFIETFTYSTSTDQANITGYWEATTTPHINQRLTFWQYTALFGQSNYQQIIATTTGFFNYSFPFTEPIASATSTGTTTPNIIPSYVLNASLDQFDNTLAASLGYPDDSIDYEGYKTNLDATSTIISSITLDYTATLQALLNYPEYECGITSITGCIKNALVWLFYPTTDTITNYYKFLDLVQSKPPVGYFTVVKSNISNLSATSTKAFNVVVPSSLKQYVFTPFDTGIAGILWLFFIFNFYKRLKHITI